MAEFRRIVGVALIAGMLAGLALAAARQAWVAPLILRAEEFEQTPAEHAGHEGHAERPIGRAEAERRAAAAKSGWQPAEGLQRNAWTWAATALASLGFALLLVAAYALSGRTVDARRGALWGLAGFTAFSAAPALGLPPALPGVPEAELAARQVWWLGTVAATVAGLALLVFGGARWRRMAGAVLIALPHWIGAPRAAGAVGALPAGLSQRFWVTTLVLNLGFWLLLGALSGWAWGRGRPAKSQ